MRKLILSALALAALAAPARAQSLAGYLAECTAVATGTCTELTGANYARQPIVFGDAQSGVVTNTTPFNFGPQASGTIAGRALYDAAAGGNLLAVIPLASPISVPPADQGEAGKIRLTLTALAGAPAGRTFSGVLATGTAIGTTSDGATVSSGSRLRIANGTLTAAAANFDASVLVSPTQTTGFTFTTLTNQGAFVVHATATLAAGTVRLPSTPLDGQTFRLMCDQTVTALTVNAVGGTTIVGTVTTCGASSGHEWVYNAAGPTWYQLF